MHKQAKLSGFTIVELLIVIVVIAILATISVIAYNGIQDRANAAAIQSDLSAAAKKIQLVAADTGNYPVGGMQEATAGAYVGNVSVEPTPSPGFSATKTSYFENVSAGSANFAYCTGPDSVTGVASFVMSGQAKSSLKIFQYSSIRGAESLGTTSLVASTICNGISYPRSYSYGYFRNASGWQAWVK